MSAESTLLGRYEAIIEAGGHQADTAQRAAAQTLDRLQQALLAAPRHSRLTRWLKRSSTENAPRGVYLWGSVGRGKTWLMDLFFDSLPFVDKRRSHFHRFMQGVHEGLRKHKRRSEPLKAVAADLAAEARVICLDELYVSDIADAMLLGGLFSALIEQQVTLVFTSNVPPSDLYRDGLQRQRFLPAIALIEQHCEIVQVDGATDYRLRQLQRRPVYLQGDAAANRGLLEEIFRTLTEDEAPGSLVEGGALRIEGRDIPVLRLGENLAWFDFAALCTGPRSQNDYVHIASEFQHVIVSDVPIFTSTDEDAARRFIALVDEFYDRRVKLIMSAAASPTELYRGERLRFEFERTASRLIEMQSEAYLASGRQLIRAEPGGRPSGASNQRDTSIASNTQGL